MTDIFPHEYVQKTSGRSGRTTERRIRYRFVPIVVPDGWTTHPGRECHDGQDGIIVEDSPSHWFEEDLWGAHNERLSLDIGCYGGVHKYVCHAHAPDWRGDLLDRAEFERPEDAAAWARSWMTRQEQQRPKETT